MPLEIRLLIGLALSSAMVYAATPLAIRVAARLDFYDKPRGYKGHAQPTPYLGGAAVVAAFVLVVLLLTSEPSHTLPVLGGVVVLWAVGTVDDRRTLPPLHRVVVEVALAAMLWVLGLGWSLGLGEIPDLLATIVWIVAVVNAFNLFDNMDGASSTMAFVVAGAIAVLGATQSDVWLAVTGAALCGACLGFLPHNLSRPSARIFLGDGGSMPIGFAIASLVMIGASTAAAQWQALVMGLLLVGVPALDTCLVVVSRRRRGISILTGGRDHLTHRTRERVRTAHGVAAALGSAQAVLAALALVAVTGGSALLVPAVLLYLVLMATVIVVLDSSPRSELAVAAAAEQRLPGPQPARTAVQMYGLFVLIPFGVALGVSPFWHGYYDSSLWVPAGLGLLLILTACLIATPVRLPGLTLVSLSAIAALALWALASASWTDSIEGAFVEGNRMFVYAAALGLLAVLVRSDRRAQWLFGAVAAGALLVGAWVVAGLLRSDTSLLLHGRLDEPLEYINGEASFFVLALWPCLALAESRRSPLLAGLGLGGATFFAALVVLGQSRGAVLAGAVSLIVVGVMLPGLLRRLAAVAVAAACLVPAVPQLLAVYSEGSPDALEHAGRLVLLCSLAAGLLWALAVYLERRVAATNGVAAQRLHRAVAAGAAGVALAAAVVGIASAGPIADFSERQYRAFVTLGGAQGEPTASRLATGAGNRYDYWRIAAEAWRTDPLRGVGAGGYDKPYFANRATAEDIRQPHSLPLQVLAELGLVGLLLLAALGIAIAVGAWRRIANVRSARAGPRRGGRRPHRLASPHERRLDPSAAGGDGNRADRRRRAAAPGGRARGGGRASRRHAATPARAHRAGGGRRSRDLGRRGQPEPPGPVGALRRAGAGCTRRAAGGGAARGQPRPAAGCGVDPRVLRQGGRSRPIRRWRGGPARPSRCRRPRAAQLRHVDAARRSRRAAGRAGAGAPLLSPRVGVESSQCGARTTCRAARLSRWGAVHAAGLAY